MPSPRRRPDSPNWSYDFRRGGRRFFGTTGTPNKKAAQAFINRLVDDIASGELERRAAEAKRQRLTLDAILGTYWANVAANQPSARTTRSQINALLDGFGKKIAEAPADELTFADLLAYRRKRRGKIADSTVNREIACLRRALNWCARHLQAPIPEIDWSAINLKEPDARVRWATEEEAEAIRSALREDLRPIFDFCLATGVRIAGARGLTWRDVDLSGGAARVRLKGGRVGTVQLSPEMTALIADQPRAVDDRGKRIPNVFTYCARGREDRRRPITADGWRKPWAAALAAAGVEDFRWHDLRHTAATRARREGADLALVQRMLHHRDVASTARYAHVSPADLAALAARMTRSRVEAPGASPSPDLDQRLAAAALRLAALARDPETDQNAIAAAADDVAALAIEAAPEAVQGADGDDSAAETTTERAATFEKWLKDK